MRGMTKSYKLGAGAAGEMVEVDTSVHLAVDSSDGGTHSVDALLTVSVGINDLAGELDEFLILKRKLPARHDHARRLRASDALGVRGPGAEAKPGTQRHHWEPIGHPRHNKRKRLMGINNGAGETAPDLLLRVSGSKGARTPDPCFTYTGDQASLHRQAAVDTSQDGLPARKAKSRGWWPAVASAPRALAA